ncbi:MAG: hypothetical protein ACI8RD_011635 [Bacillariaceae sp.]|jgi:hypothetical protein
MKHTAKTILLLLNHISTHSSIIYTEIINDTLFGIAVKEILRNKTTDLVKKSFIRSFRLARPFSQKRLGLLLF